MPVAERHAEADEEQPGIAAPGGALTSGERSAPPFLSVVIPCYNEAGRIRSTLERIGAYLAERAWDAEILVCDDGSTDDTQAVVTECAKRLRVPVRLLGHTPNRGKGYTVREGVLASEGDFVLFSDADLSTPIEELDVFMPLLTSGHYDVVIGSRGLPESRLQLRQPRYRELMGRTFNLLVQAIGLRGFKDTQCGFKLFRREVARRLFSMQTVPGFAFDVEIVLLAVLCGYRVKEQPVTWINSPVSRVSPLWDSFRMLWELTRIRINWLRGKYPRQACR